MKLYNMYIHMYLNLRENLTAGGGGEGIVFWSDSQLSNVPTHSTEPGTPSSSSSSSSKDRIDDMVLIISFFTPGLMYVHVVLPALLRLAELGGADHPFSFPFG